MGYIRRTERYDDVENWNEINPVLAAGEIGVAECIIGGKKIARVKVGNGEDAWKDLPYQDEIYKLLEG